MEVSEIKSTFKFTKEEIFSALATAFPAEFSKYTKDSITYVGPQFPDLTNVYVHIKEAS